MKTKIKKIKSAKNIVERLRGVGLWQINGPSITTGKRVMVQFTGTREEAEKVELK